MEAPSLSNKVHSSTIYELMDRVVCMSVGQSILLYIRSCSIVLVTLTKILLKKKLLAKALNPHRIT